MVASAALLAVAAMLLAVVAVVLGASTAVTAGLEGAGAREAPSALAGADIPSRYLRLYQAAAARYGLRWSILAGIGKVECNHGRDPAPSCLQSGAVNSAGAGGPMQFLASTWSVYGVDGNNDGRRDRWDPADAIFAAANYLSDSGAPQDYSRAIFAYNHAAWYVRSVEAWAARYSSSGASSQAVPLVVSSDFGARLQSQTSTPVRLVGGSQASLAPDDGRVALIPAELPAPVQAMLVAGNELQRLPYGPGGHPDPLGASEEDCSSTINYILYRSGIRPLSEILSENPLAQDYVRWGAPGPGKWVTIYSTLTPTPHVFAVIAGLRIDTSHNGTDTGPNRAEDGPRWRLLDHIPAWAHWSVRHPPGL